jgi:hypothetical protein
MAMQFLAIMALKFIVGKSSTVQKKEIYVDQLGIVGCTNLQTTLIHENDHYNINTHRTRS